MKTIVLLILLGACGFTCHAQVITTQLVSTNMDSLGDNDDRFEATITYEVTAVDSDVWLFLTSSISTSSFGGNLGTEFSITGSVPLTLPSNRWASTMEAYGSVGIDGDTALIREGDTGIFVLSVYGTVPVSGAYRVTLDSVQVYTNPALPGVTYDFPLEYRTLYRFVNESEAIPEPSAVGLFGLSIGAMLVRTRRKF